MYELGIMLELGYRMEIISLMLRSLDLMMWWGRRLWWVLLLLIMVQRC